MLTHKLTKSLVVLAVLSAIGLVSAGSMGALRPDIIIPIITTISPSNAAPGQTLNITVGLNNAPAQDVEVAISTNKPGFFTNLPSSVTVPAGQSQKTFSATLTTSANSPVTVTSTLNGTSSSGSANVQTE